MRFFLLVIFLFSENVTLSQNKLNSKGQKQGLWEEYYPETKILKWQGNFENGIQKGIFKFFDKKGELQEEIDFINENECLAKFYENKKIKTIGLYRNKNKNGEWKYYEKDKLVMVENYKNGILDGERKIFYENGNIMGLENYNDGKLNGVFRKWTDDGSLIEEANYTKGLKNGEYISYYGNGKIANKGRYEDDKKIGKWIYFDIKGKKKEEDLSKKKLRKGKWIDESSPEGKFFYKKFRE